MPDIKRGSEQREQAKVWIWKFLDMYHRKFRAQVLKCEQRVAKLDKEEVKLIKSGTDPRTLLALREERNDAALMRAKYKAYADELEGSMIKLGKISK